MADTDNLPGEIRPRMTLSTGTVLAFYRMENSATAVDPTHGGAMTHAEWEEYCKKLKTLILENIVSHKNAVSPIAVAMMEARKPK